MSQNVADFVRDLQAASGHVDRDLAEALDSVKPRLLEAIAENFRSQSTAGTAWPPRQDTGFSHPLLNKSGALMAAASTTGAPSHIERTVEDGDGLTLELGVDASGQQGGIPGAAVHNYGATIRPVQKEYLSWIDGSGTRRFAKQVTIPQREYMAVGDDVVDECGETVADKLLNEVA